MDSNKLISDEVRKEIKKVLGDLQKAFDDIDTFTQSKVKHGVIKEEDRPEYQQLEKYFYAALKKIPDFF